MGRTHTEKYVEDSPVGGTSYWCRRRTSLPEGEAAADTACDELTVMSIPCLPVLQSGRRQRIGNKDQEEAYYGEGKVFL